MLGGGEWEGLMTVLVFCGVLEYFMLYEWCVVLEVAELLMTVW
jgi:hypothetical protein